MIAKTQGHWNIKSVIEKYPSALANLHWSRKKPKTPANSTHWSAFFLLPFSVFLLSLVFPLFG